jgi:hypothetical protein
MAIFLSYIFGWDGPVALKKDLEPRQRIQAGFWDAVTEFEKLPAEVRKQYLIYG